MLLQSYVSTEMYRLSMQYCRTVPNKQELAIFSWNCAHASSEEYLGASKITCMTSTVIHHTLHVQQCTCMCRHAVQVMQAELTDVGGI